MDDVYINRKMQSTLQVTYIDAVSQYHFLWDLSVTLSAACTDDRMIRRES
jgi:hypothetical protein